MVEFGYRRTGSARFSAEIFRPAMLLAGLSVVRGFPLSPWGNLAMQGVSAMSIDLSALSGGDIAVALRSGKCDVPSVVAHLANRLLPADQFGQLLASQAIPPEYFGAVMLAQSALQQKKPAGSKLPAVRATVSASGKRIVCVQPPKDACPGGYTMTNPPASWLWIINNAAAIKTACEEAAKIDDATVAKTVADKLVKAATAAAK